MILYLVYGLKIAYNVCYLLNSEFQRVRRFLLTPANPTPNAPHTSLQMASLAANLAEGKKASDTLVLDTGRVSYLADYFVICTADSTSQLRAIAEEVKKAFRDRGEALISPRADMSPKWCLLDYGDVVIHIFHRTEREFYKLEDFWSHANPVPEAQWRQPDLQQAS
jgi:ribosome-associated protein